MQINHLILVGGPSCSGKSYTIGKIQRGECGDLGQQLGFMDPSSWRYVHAWELANLPEPKIERLLVHYDIYAQRSDEAGFGYVEELIANSQHATVLTLCARPRVLIKRSNKRIFRKWLKRLRERIDSTVSGRKAELEPPRRIRRRWEKRREYGRGHSVLLYQEWFEFIDRLGVQTHWLLDVNPSNVFVAHPYEMDRGRALTRERGSARSTR